ncbi:hypothetical protein BC826DRAFT_971082 [Russula brevipes]|nr:hypothetical protein BC826DRAFT_971082 [Russula brevipes]
MNVQLAVVAALHGRCSSDSTVTVRASSGEESTLLRQWRYQFLDGDEAHGVDVGIEELEVDAKAIRDNQKAREMEIGRSTKPGFPNYCGSHSRWELRACVTRIPEHWGCDARQGNAFERGLHPLAHRPASYATTTDPSRRVKEAYGGRDSRCRPADIQG